MITAEQVKALLEGATPGPWEAFPKPKYNEWHVSLPIPDTAMRLGLFPDGMPGNHPEADAKLIAAVHDIATAFMAQAAIEAISRKLRLRSAGQIERAAAVLTLLADDKEAQAEFRRRHLGYHAGEIQFEDAERLFMEDQPRRVSLSGKIFALQAPELRDLSAAVLSLAQPQPAPALPTPELPTLEALHPTTLEAQAVLKQLYYACKATAANIAEFKRITDPEIAEQLLAAVEAVFPSPQSAPDAPLGYSAAQVQQMVMDAIRRPMGVVPDSCTEVYRAALAEVDAP